MAERFIEEQDKVLKVFDASAIISASAGSGKTSVLIRKISNYIEDKNIDISNILALTYTNAAAGEMKERLQQSLIKSIENESFLEDNEEYFLTNNKNRLKGKKELLIQQIDRISTADISTFHSFYERILKKYFYVIGIDSSFEILEDAENIVLKNAAFEEAIKNLKEKDFEGYFKMSDILGKKRRDNSIKERVFKIDEFLSSQLDKEDWMNKTALRMVQNREETYNMLCQYIEKHKQETIVDFTNILSEELSPQAVSYINICTSLLEDIDTSSFEKMYNSIQDFSFPTIRLKNDDEKKSITDVREYFKDLMLRYKKFGEFDVIKKSFESCEYNMKTLLNLYKDYSKILHNKKVKLNKYSFNDIEEFCLQILSNNTVREEVKKQYKLIFIDEFQDTNPIQYEIIKRISSDDNVFIVGDPKQSIYAFRQTDVDIFNNVFDMFSQGTSKALFLKKNFRSNPKILDFANNIFDVIMTKDLSGIDYKSSSRFEPESENSCDNYSVEISLVEKDLQKKAGLEADSIYDIFSDTSDTNDENLEANLISNQIGKVLEECIFDDKVKERRKVGYGDIAILMKDRLTLLSDLTKNFQKYNIPYLVNDKIDLLQSKEVKLIISLLNLVNNIKDDVKLATILCSDFAGLSYDDIAEVKKAYDEEYFYDCYFKYIQEKNNIISKKLTDFNQLINDLKFDIRFKGVSLALSLLFTKYDFLEKIKTRKNGDIKSEILQQFVSFIEKSPFNNDLLELLKFIDNNKNIFVSSVKRNSLDAVQITTIHGSKGLEYPVVFLCDAGKDIASTKPGMSDLKISKNFGIAIKNYYEKERRIYPSIFEEIIKIERDAKDLAESFRLLYVALTRAKNKLFISGEFDKNKVVKITNESNLLKIKPTTFLNFIIGALDDEILEKLNSQGKYSNESLHIAYINKDNFENKHTQDKIFFEEKETEQKNFNLQQIYKFANSNWEEYRYKNSTMLSQKTTVTEIATESDGYESLAYEPKNFTISEHYNGVATAEQGNIIHNILEKTDFYLPEEDLIIEIEKNINRYNNQIMNFEYLKNLIKNNINILKKIIPNNSNLYKEKMFMLKTSLKNIFGEESDEEILIQGKIDLIALGGKNIIMDYKYTSITDEKRLIDRYIRQLKAYQFAVEKALGIKIDEVYIFDIKNSRAILITF